MSEDAQKIAIHCKYDELVPVKDLRPHPKNRNKHPKDQIQRLAKLIAYQGVRAPVIVSRRSNFIVKGHGTLQAFKLNGGLFAPICWQDFDSDEQEYAFLQSDNAIASWSELDLSGINLDMVDLGPDFDVDMLGIKDFEIDPADKGATEDTVPAPPKNPVTKVGDIWTLGRHRVLCGDSTHLDGINRLMQGQRADMCFTSPPYNLASNAKLRGHNGDGKDSAYNDHSDHKTEEEYLSFLVKFTEIALEVSDTAFINLQLLAGNKFALPNYWHHFHEQLIDLFVWDKEHAAPAMAPRVLNSVWEFIFIFGNEHRPKRSMKHGDEFRGTVDNIFRLNPIGKKDPLAKDHGAVFPVAFAHHFISRFSDKSVFEPFCGSGTTVVASEQVGRQCFAVELDPAYVDVTIERWQNLTGEKATR